MNLSDKFWDLPTGVVVLLVVAFVAAIILPFCHLCIHSVIAEYAAVELTIQQSRDQDISAIERAAIQQTICKWNASLAQYRYWNELPFFGWYIPNAVDSIEFMK